MPREAPVTSALGAGDIAGKLPLATRRVGRIPALVRSLVVSLLTFLLASVSDALPAQAPVRYELSFPNHLHHEAEVEIVFPEVATDARDTDEPLVARSPGST